MTSEEFDAFCRSLRATTHVVQWGGAHVWKVGGKVFAIASGRDDEPGITFKVSDIAYEMLRSSRACAPRPISHRAA
jgi:predicted DNA-binding protein (MmcQ/YjbR family)